MRMISIGITRYGLALTALGILLGGSQTALAQCTTAAWSSTTGSVTAIGSTVEKTELEYEGSCGLSIQASASPGYVTSAAPNSDELVLSRFYIYPEELVLNGAQDEAIVFQARGNSAVQLQLVIRQLGNGLGLVMKYRSNGSLIEDNEVAPLLPTWQAVTVGWNADAISGSAYVKVDGREMITAEGINNNGEFISNLDLGLINDVNGSGKIVVDAFEARRAIPEPPLLAVSELYNISTRTEVGTGASVTIAGFIIDGPTQKCVLVRARGQSINITGPRVQDPVLLLQIPSTGELVDSNDDWMDHPNAAVVVASGLQPANNSEAAIYTCLDPGSYTALLRGAPSTALGIGIVEVFDLDQGTPFLYNISTRADVKTGAGIAIAGFIVEGEQPKEVLIRGRGPSVNVPETRLANPVLNLFSGQTVINSNNDWQSAPNSAAIQETGLAPGNGLEAAILTTLVPGIYTVHLSPADGQTGIGIIEVFDLTGGSVEPN